MSLIKTTLDADMEALKNIVLQKAARPLNFTSWMYFKKSRVAVGDFLFRSLWVHSRPNRLPMIAGTVIYLAIILSTTAPEGAAEKSRYLHFVDEWGPAELQRRQEAHYANMYAQKQLAALMQKGSHGGHH